MPRKRRQELAGGIFHVFARGVERRRIFLDDLDRKLYLALLAGVTRRQGWHCLAYCLMENHIHVLIETPEPNLSVGMQRIHGTFAQAFNDRYARSGHLFERRFGDRVVVEPAQLAVVAAYIAANPVEAHLVDTAEEWAWGSHAVMAEGAAPSWLAVNRLHALLGEQGGDPLTTYREAIRQRLVGPAASLAAAA